MNIILTAENLDKTYHLPHKSVPVLRNASLAIGATERVAIVGRSGAGKSTLLHVLGGLDQPDAGNVCITDENVYALPPRDRSLMRAQKIGFVFQSYHLLPEMDVTENVMLPALAAGITPARARSRALALLANVGLSDRATHTPMELSGGEQQRVALARALMNNPALVLADEPTGNLDRDTGEQILELLFGGLASQKPHALVVVTHSPELAARCDRTLRLECGQLIPEK